MSGPGSGAPAAQGTDLSAIPGRGTLTIATPLGPLEIAGSPRGVRAIRFVRSGLPGNPATGAGGPRAVSHGFAAVPAPLQAAADQLTAYFAGQRRQFDFPLDLEGTPFQLAVWRCLLTIPFGETRSYGWVAAAVGRPRGARAVGRAVGQNPVAIAVPCHRVIAADGSLGGYTGGLDIKRFLLRLEGREDWTP